MVKGIAAGSSLAFGDMGTPGDISVGGAAFPILLSDAGEVVGAAARINNTGRVVAFVKEGAALQR